MSGEPNKYTCTGCGDTGVSFGVRPSGWGMEITTGPPSSWRRWCPPCRDRRVEAAPETPRPPVQEPASGPETPEPSTDRGTGVGGPHGRSEVVQWGQGGNCAHKPEWHCETHGECRGCECGCDTVNPELDLTSAHWLKFNDAREITGCQCGFAADIDSDCGFGDSVVRHLLEVGAEAAAPDVDGWTLTATTRGVMVSHSTDADMPVFGLRTGDNTPVGAVLAFIADQRPELVAYEAHCDNCKTTSEKGRTDER